MCSGFSAETLDSLRQRWDIVDIPNQREALSRLQSGELHPDAIVIGYVTTHGYTPIGLDDDIGVREMLDGILQLNPNLPVIISTHCQRIDAVVDLIRLGAFDYIIEPEPEDDPAKLTAFRENLDISIGKAVHWRSVFKENEKLRGELLGSGSSSSPLIARSDAMARILNLAKKVAPTPATVLITGESGTGKECLARLIHELSREREESFTAINCGSMGDHLLASELFGHVKGAFTGAHADRPGMLREAGKGTLFLDEIGTVSQAFQVMLLRVLEERTARPVGGSSDYPVHTRFIAAANRDLQAMVEEGSFREDLWYRLSVFRIHIPPLRQRQEDIPSLSLHFLNKACQSFGKDIAGIESAAMSRLEGYHWPGNVRQLRNVMERAAIVCEGRRISIGDLELCERTTPPPISETPLPKNLSYGNAMERFERRLIEQSLRDAGGNIARAAAALDIKRTTLHYRIQKLGLADKLKPHSA